MITQQTIAPRHKALFQLLLAFILSIAGVGICLKSIAFQHNYFNSDNLYMVDYFESLKEGILSSFQYSHSPNLFPEGPIMLPLLAAHAPWQLVYAFYSSTMFLVLILSVRKIYAGACPRHCDEGFYLFVLFSVLVLVNSWPHIQFMPAGVHGGSFVVSIMGAVASWGFLSGGLRIPWSLLCGLALMTGASSFSDVLFLFEFVVPLVVATSALAFFRHFPLLKILTLNLAVIGAAVAGAFVLHLLPKSPFPPHSFKDLFDNSRLFFSSSQMSFFVAFVFPFLIVSICFGACLYFRSAWARMIGRLCGSPLADKSSANAWLFYWAFGLIASLATLGIMISAYQDDESYRYALAFFWWPLILGLTLLARPASRFRLLLPKVAVLGVTGLLFGAAFWPTPVIWASDLARCLEEKSDIFSMHAGLAEYWTARPVSKFSQRKYFISQVVRDGDPYMWINNRLDYFTDKEGKNLRDYDFVILNALDREAIISKFGQPSHSFQCGTYDIAQYDDPSIIRSALARWFAEHK